MTLSLSLIALVSFVVALIVELIQYFYYKKPIPTERILLIVGLFFLITSSMPHRFGLFSESIAKTYAISATLIGCVVIAFLFYKKFIKKNK